MKRFIGWILSKLFPFCVGDTVEKDVSVNGVSINNWDVVKSKESEIYYGGHDSTWRLVR